jgi:hypothetical protein
MNLEQMKDALYGEGYEYVASRYVASGLEQAAPLIASVYEKEGRGRLVILSAGHGGAQLFAPANIEDFLTPRDPEAPTLTISAPGYEWEVFVYDGGDGTFYSQEPSEFPIKWMLKPRGAVFERQHPEPRSLPEGVKLLRECEAPTQLLDQLREIYARAPGTPLPY